MRSSSLLAVVLAAVVFVSGGAAGGSAEPQAVTLEQARSAISTGALPSTRAPARSAATWCGTPAQADLRPNTLSGFPVHWIYVLPSDAPDRFSTFASVMQTDAEAIDAWWRREDTARMPRNDLTQLSCGAQLDHQTLRLPQSSAQLAAQEGRFVTLFDCASRRQLQIAIHQVRRLLRRPRRRGGHLRAGCDSSSGIGVAAVYVQACAGVSTAAVAAHEFLHTLGAVSRNAPHNCPEPNGGHTCDSRVTCCTRSWTALRSTRRLLDPGRDDYYGHPAASPTPRTLPGSCSSIASSRSRSRSPARAE